MMSSSTTSRHAPRSFSLRYRHIAAALVACMLLSALRPLQTLAQAPLDDEAVGGVGLELAWQMGGAITALDVQGDYAYLGVGPRLVILDVSDPTNPFQVSQTEVLPSVDSGAPEPYAQICAISVVTDTAHLAIVSADENLSLRLVDVSDPTDPQPGAGVIPILDYPRALPSSVELCWFDGKLVVGCTADDWSYESDVTLFLVDMIDDVPQWEGRFGPCWSRGSYGRLLDVSSHNGRLHVLREYYGDCTWDSYDPPLTASNDPSSAEPVSTPSASRYLAPLFSSLHGDAWTLCTEASDYIVSHDRIYAVEPAATVEPTAYPSCALSDTATRDACLTQDGHFAAVVSESETLIVDLREPLEPTVVGRVALGGQYVDVAGDHAYVAGGGELHVVDISDPSQPQAMGAWRQPEWTAVSHLEVLSPDRLLVSVGSQLLALDTPADAEPTIAGGLDVGAPINDFCLLEGEGCDLMLATDGLGLLPVGLDDEGLPFLDLYGPLQSCDVNYVSIVQTSWEEEDYSGSPCTERRILALTDDRSLAMDVATYRQQCPEHLVSVCEGFSLDQVAGRYAYVGRTLYREGWPESGQIEVYDLSDGHAPSVASVITTEHPVDSIVPHDGCLYVGGVGWTGANATSASTLLRVFDLSTPVEPRLVHASELGPFLGCEDIYRGCVSANIEAATGNWLVTSDYYAGYCWCNNGGSTHGPGLAILRVNKGPELQLVWELLCRNTTVLGAADDMLFTVDSTFGSVTWRVAPRPAWGAFSEAESCLPPLEWRDPEQYLGHDPHASGCGYVGGGFAWEVPVPRLADYYLWVRLRESDPDLGTFALWTPDFLGYSSPIGEFDGTPGSDAWAWHKVGKVNNMCGLTCLGFSMKHPSAAIDCLYLTDSPDAIPPMITPCVPAGLVLLPMVMR